MNLFDWLSFLDRNGIEYVTAGPNVAKNNVNIHCPFCGAGDPSHHLGISLVGPWWGCWRDPTHRGKSAARLVQALLGCSWAQAEAIVGEAAALPGDLLSSVEALLAKPASASLSSGKSLSMPEEFKPIVNTTAFRYVWRYLRERRYTDAQIETLTPKYGIRFAKSGPFGGRIIFPIFHEGKLVTWTGRTIFKGEELRYKTLTVDQDRARVLRLEPAVGNISEFLLWYDDLTADSNDTLFIVEGPFDALRIRVFGERLGVTATCFFTSAPSKTQMQLFYEVLPKYKRRFLLLDEGTLDKAHRIEAAFGDWATAVGVDVLQLPPGVKDPGDLTRKEFGSLVR